MIKKHIKRSLGMKGSEFTKPILAGGSLALGFGAGMALSGGNPIGGILGGLGGGYAYSRSRSFFGKRMRICV